MRRALYGGTARFDYFMVVGRPGTPTRAKWDVVYQDVSLRADRLLEVSASASTDARAARTTGMGTREVEGQTRPRDARSRRLPRAKTMTRDFQADVLAAEEASHPSRTVQPRAARVRAIAGRVVYALDPEWITSTRAGWRAQTSGFQTGGPRTASGPDPVPRDDPRWWRATGLAGIMTAFDHLRGPCRGGWAVRRCDAGGFHQGPGSKDSSGRNMARGTRTGARERRRS